MEGGAFLLLLSECVSWGAAVTGLFLFFLLYIFYRRAVYIVHLEISDGE